MANDMKDESQRCPVLLILPVAGNRTREKEKRHHWSGLVKTGIFWLGKFKKKEAHWRIITAKRKAKREGHGRVSTRATNYVARSRHYSATHFKSLNIFLSWKRELLACLVFFNTILSDWEIRRQKPKGGTFFAGVFQVNFALMDGWMNDLSVVFFGGPWQSSKKKKKVRLYRLHFLSQHSLTTSCNPRLYTTPPPHRSLPQWQVPRRSTSFSDASALAD